MIPLGKPKIDSLRIHLPLDEVTVNKQHQTFLRSITSINEDAEVINQHTQTTYFNPEALISCSYAVRSIFGVETLFIGFSSKLLKELYFNGIDKNTMQRCLNFINNEGLIQITKETILNATPVDVDFCIDYFLDSEGSNIKEVINVCSELTRPSKSVNMYAYRKDTNLGIQWGNRDKIGKAYKTRQFLKYYAKAVELKYNSNEFYEAYLKNGLNQTLIDADGSTITEGNKYFKEDKLLRVETTIKNGLHFETYKYKVKTLRDLLNLKLDKDFLNIFTRPMACYMDGYREVKHAEDMTPQQHFKYLALLYRAKDLKLRIEDVIPTMVTQIYPDAKDKQSRSRLKGELFEIIRMQEVGKQKHKDDTEQFQLFRKELEAKCIIP